MLHLLYRTLLPKFYWCWRSRNRTVVSVGCVE